MSLLTHKHIKYNYTCNTLGDLNVMLVKEIRRIILSRDNITAIFTTQSLIVYWEHRFIVNNGCYIFKEYVSIFDTILWVNKNLITDLPPVMFRAFHLLPVLGNLNNDSSDKFVSRSVFSISDIDGTNKFNRRH